MALEEDLIDEPHSRRNCESGRAPKLRAGPRFGLRSLSMDGFLRGWCRSRDASEARMARLKSISERKKTKRTLEDWIEFREVRLAKRPSVYRDHSSVRRRKIAALQIDADLRLRFLQDAFDYGSLVSSTDYGLTAPLAELVFGYGAERLATRLGFTPKLFYRSFSFTEPRALKLQTLIPVLANFGLKLQLTKMTAGEIDFFERSLADAREARPQPIEARPHPAGAKMARAVKLLYGSNPRHLVPGEIELR